MEKLPLCSSSEIIKVLETDGFQLGKSKSGSHQSLHKRLPSGRTITTVVILGKREVPRGTLQHILTLAGMPRERFLELLRD